MIHPTRISKQHGSRLLFQEASLQILPARRTGLAGPNGAGKTTIFRPITKEEGPDKGEIACAKKTVIGYFSQVVGEMSVRPALAEVMAAAAAITLLVNRVLLIDHGALRGYDGDYNDSLRQFAAEQTGSFPEASLS